MIEHETQIERIVGLAVAPPAGNRSGYVLVDCIDAEGRPAAMSITPAAARSLARALARAGYAAPA